MLMLLCVLAHAGPTKDDVRQLLVGRWQPVTEGLTLEFTADGHYIASGDPKSQALKGTYRWIDQETIEVTMDFLPQKPGLLGISIDGDRLAIADPPAKHGKRVKPDQYRRIK